MKSLHKVLDNHVSEDFLCLHFAVDQFQDMIRKMEECCANENIELKIWQ